MVSITRISVVVGAIMAVAPVYAAQGSVEVVKVKPELGLTLAALLGIITSLKAITYIALLVSLRAWKS